MEKKEMYELSLDELIHVDGGYVQPTEEQLETLRRIYGPLADTIVCW